MADKKQLSLREAAKFDYDTNQKEKLTGWGIISKLRASTGVSKKERRKKRGQ